MVLEVKDRAMGGSIRKERCEYDSYVNAFNVCTAP